MRWLARVGYDRNEIPPYRLSLSSRRVNLVAQSLSNLPSPLLVGLFVGLVVIIVVLYVYIWPKKDQPPEVKPVEIAIDPLVPSGPKSLLGPEVRVYNVPVRIVAIVVAHAGRGRDLLDEETLRRLMDHFLPKMMTVVRAHRPDVYRWPGQMSTRGFTQRFFAQANLPGEKGKGTPWTALAGRFDFQGQGYLIGLVCCADDSNALEHIMVKSTEQWTDIVRIQ